jgi:hypothetical protein
MTIECLDAATLNSTIHTNIQIIFCAPWDNMALEIMKNALKHPNYVMYTKKHDIVMRVSSAS